MSHGGFFLHDVLKEGLHWAFVVLLVLVDGGLHVVVHLSPGCVWNCLGGVVVSWETVEISQYW